MIVLTALLLVALAGLACVLGANAYAGAFPPAGIYHLSRRARVLNGVLGFVFGAAYVVLLAVAF